MSAGHLFYDLRRQGFILSIGDDMSLLVKPKRLMTPKIATLIKEHREGLLDLLWIELPVGLTPDFAGHPVLLREVYRVDVFGTAVVIEKEVFEKLIIYTERAKKCITGLSSRAEKPVKIQSMFMQPVS